MSTAIELAEAIGEYKGLCDAKLDEKDTRIKELEAQLLQTQEATLRKLVEWDARIQQLEAQALLDAGVRLAAISIGDELPNLQNVIVSNRSTMGISNIIRLLTELRAALAKKVK